MSTTNRIFLVLNLLIGAFLLGSMSSQSVSAVESNGVISACVSKSNGALRISNKCTKLETRISWNQTGPAGAIGPAGPAGPAGIPGTDAYVKTKTIQIKYIGTGSDCGTGGWSFLADTRTYSGWSLSPSNLSNSLNWTYNSYCTAYIKVVE